MSVSDDSICPDTFWKILIIDELGLTHHVQSRKLRDAWISACHLILENRIKVHTLAPYQLEGELL